MVCGLALWPLTACPDVQVATRADLNPTGDRFDKALSEWREASRLVARLINIDADQAIAGHGVAQAREPVRMLHEERVGQLVGH